MRGERISTGIVGFDPFINGGFLKGSLNMVAGNPGTGKTIFAAQFMYHGAKHGEPGVYVSFAESAETFRAAMLGLGLDFRPLEKLGRFKFLDLVTVKKEGVSVIFRRIMDEIESTKAKRLVIDSYTVLAQAFEEKIEARVMVHDILGKIVRQLGCTILIIVEVPVGHGDIGLGVEEFVADSIIELSHDVSGVYPRRRIRVRKMRGTAHTPYTNDFIIKSGIGIELIPIHRPSAEKVEKAVSTGIPQVDEMLGGGIPYGSLYLFEIDSGIDQLSYETNFLRSVVIAKDVYVQIINSTLSPRKILRGVDLAGIRGQFDKAVKEGDIVLLDPFDRELTEEMRRYVTSIVGFSSEKIVYTLEAMFRRFSSEGKSVRLESDISDMVAVIGVEAFLHIFPRFVAYVKEYDGVWLGTFKPETVSQQLAQKVRSTAEGIIKVWSEGNYHFIQVIKSKNKIYSRPLRYIETNKRPFIKIID
ncbi:MAG: ATPase domain-containing protein [Candidatus Bathyarchaeia archaeon]